MTTQMTVTTRDLRRLADVVDPAHLDSPGEPMPVSLLQALADVVPCDDVTYESQDPVAAREIRVQTVPAYDEDDDPELTDFYWNSVWTCTPWNPYRTGDYVTVRKATDLWSKAEYEASADAEYHRIIGLRHLVTVPLPPRGPIDYRIMLWRADGRDFSDREVALLQLLRPHLVLLHEQVLNRASPVRRLTPRQQQLLRLIAAGLTNAQVARRLSVSEGTVRSHLENIYERLEVNSRTGAVTTAFGTHAL